MTIEIEKFSTFNKERKTTLNAISAAVSVLAKHFPSALKQQIYMHVNPDNNGANELIDIVSDQVNSLAGALADVNKQAADLMSVKEGNMTIDQLLAKYPAINMIEYSNELL